MSKFVNKIPVSVPSVFKPLYHSRKRNIVAYGGRGSGKTQNFAEKLVIQMLTDTRKHGHYILAREQLKNLKSSSKEEILKAIRKLGVEKYFKYSDTGSEITCTINKCKFDCIGLRNEQEATHIKSFTNIRVVWIDEAVNIKEAVFDLVTPSIRGSNDSQILITFNPAKRSDYMYQRFVLNPDPLSDEVFKVNYTENPYFPDVLERERQSSERRSPTSYKRIWLGEAGNADDIIIDPQWFGYYDVLPPLQYRFMFVDTAQKDKEHNDYTVCGIFGMGVDGKLYVIDIFRHKIKAFELRNRVPAYWYQHEGCKHRLYVSKEAQYGVLTLAHIEDAVSGTALIQEFEYTFKIPVNPIIRTRDKYTRALDAQPYIESGLVMLDRNAPWLNDFLLECEAFNATGDYDHDDQVDVLVDAVTKMLVEVKPFWEYV